MGMGQTVPRTYCVYVVSLGCAKNLVDSEVMCGLLAADGFLLTPDLRQADIVLINTCGFIADAREESEAEIHDALRWKRKGKRRMVVVSGCLPQRLGNNLACMFPKVDLFLDLDDIPNAAALIRAKMESPGGTRNIPFGELPTYLYDHMIPRLPLTPVSYGFVKIAEGCDHRCAYCAIPSIRGRQRSRDPESVIEECRQLLRIGKRELNLIAQDTTRYGADRQDGACLTTLIKACDRLPDEFWLRVLYTHPAHVTDDFLEAIVSSDHIVPYLDMPLQHISDGVLKAMRRKLGGRATRDLVARIRRQCPDLAIRTTFLVGFPGESEADFEELLEFAEESRFERLGVFTFSPEINTPAYDMAEGQVPVPVAVERRERLLDLQQRLSLERNRGLIGRTLDVLVDTADEEGNLVARTCHDAPDVDNIVHIAATADIHPGQFAAVTIVGADAYDLDAVSKTADGQNPIR